MSDLYLRQIPVGPMANFAYLIGSQSARTCYAVDPAWDIPALRAQAEADGMRIAGALITHYHPDHCGGHIWGYDIPGVAELVGSEAMPVYAHADELPGLVTVTGLARSDFKPCRSGDTLTVGGVEIKMIHTPGHTPGSQCFLCADQLIAGDTLFISGCGRVDLPGGSSDQLFESLNGTLAKLPNETVLYPGHSYDAQPSATLADVRRVNPYLRAGSLTEWRRMFGPS